jgi:hypothetical protein
MNEREMVAMTARMDGAASVARRIRKEHLVSDMELIALVNMAQIGLFGICAELLGERGEQAKHEYEQIIATLEVRNVDPGINSLTTIMDCCAAILGQERFQKYLLA